LPQVPRYRAIQPAASAVVPDTTQVPNPVEEGYMARIPRSVVTVAIGAALALGVAAAPAAAAKKPPVKIDGPVTNEGVGTVRNGAATIKAGNFSFEKTFLKTAPGTVEVTVENTSSATHTFTVDGQDVDEQLAPGAKKTVSIAVGADEPVVFYCRFHQGTGMKGAFFTATGATATSPKATASAPGGYGY